MSQPQPDTEELTFKIGLSGTFWEKRPAFSVWVNDQIIVKDYIQNNDIQYIEFSANVKENEVNQLKIRLENKTDSDTVVLDDIIVKDMLLNIETIEIDGIELELVKWSESIFVPDDPINRPEIPECVNLGWNGTYILNFHSPFYLWLLEKI